MESRSHHREISYEPQRLQGAKRYSLQCDIESIAGLHFVGGDAEFLHIVVASEEKLKSLKSGDKLKPVWKEERIGTIRDIDYFVPENT